MYRLIVILFIICGWQSAAAQQQSESAFRNQLDAQFRVSVSRPETFIRRLSVWQKGQMETQEIRLVASDSSEVLYQRLSEIMKPWLKQTILNPELSDWFTILTSGDTVRGFRKEEYESKTRVAEQTLVINASTGVVEWIEVKTIRENWLYAEVSTLKVKFNRKGIYRYHQLSLKTEVPLSGTFIRLVDTGYLSK